MGTAIGSLSTIHIALSEKNYHIRGIILISPINCKERLSKEDHNDVFHRLPEVKCPVLLVHGRQDEVTPFQRSADIINKIRYAFEWFPTKGTHNNLITKYRSKFLGKVKFFLEHLNYHSQKSTENMNSNEGTDISRVTDVKLKNYIIDKEYLGCKNNKNVYRSPVRSKFVS
jgi:hypothetical protein